MAGERGHRRPLVTAYDWERDRYMRAVRGLYLAAWWSRLCTRMRF